MWFIDDTDRWEREQRNLKAIGVACKVDDAAKEAGVIRLFLTIDQQSNIGGLPAKFLPLKLTVVYPGAYPYFRPDVYADALALPRHQNPLAKNLCLLPRGSSFWLPETTLAEHLTEQLPKVLVEGEITDPHALKANAEEQAEPASEYYPAIPNAPIMMDTTGFDALPATDQPVAFLGSFTAGFPPDTAAPSRIWAMECFDAAGNSIAKLPASIFDSFLLRRKCFVYQLQERPPHGEPVNDFLWVTKAVQSSKGAYRKPAAATMLKNQTTVEQVIGLTFPEEHHPGELSRGWLFLIEMTKYLKITKGAKDTLQKVQHIYYAKVNRINQDELTFRIPALKPLANKTVAIFGLGALGGPAAIELAKNGAAEIRLVDFDLVSAGTIIRWPLGISAAGMFKTDALAGFIRTNYPYTNVRCFDYKVGAQEMGAAGAQPPITNYEQYINELLADVSLIYDAAAETGVSHMLSEEAKKRKIPFVSVFATPGVWGGAVMRVVPGAQRGCWMCFQYALRDGFIPNPPMNREGTIQPAGCGDISFTGTSFELANIVSSGVRLAISTLCSAEGGYPNLNEDIGILALVDDHGDPIFPRWSTHHLDIHPDCPYCHA